MIAVEFKNVVKEYKLYKTEMKRLLGIFFKNIHFQKKRAVSDVSFTINKGEAVAIFGKNGAGKTTILKMITGVCFPTTGEVYVDGIVSAMLGLSTGFDSDFTGRENIYLKGRLMGLKDDTIKSIEKTIVDFAEIDEYIDQPMKKYSSGMKARLGFAINANINPEILIIDEALSVGDREFRNKCREKMDEIMNNGNVTLLFVTHSASTASQFCDRGIVLQKGEMIFDGELDESIQIYNSTLKKSERRRRRRRNRRSIMGYKKKNETTLSENSDVIEENTDIKNNETENQIDIEDIDSVVDDIDN